MILHLIDDHSIKVSKRHLKPTSSLLPSSFSPPITITDYELLRVLVRISRYKVHQSWSQAVIGLKTNVVQLLPHISHLLRIETLLDDAADERSELRLLPAVLRTQLSVDEVQTLEWMSLLDSAVHMGTTFSASMALDSGTLIDDFELVLVRCHLG